MKAKARLESLLVRYGGIALATYLVIFAVVLAGFAIAISTGLKTESATGLLATLGAAWGATKLTQPLRIGATVLLTPLVARLLGRGGRDAAGGSADDSAGKSVGDSAGNTAP